MVFVVRGTFLLVGLLLLVTLFHPGFAQQSTRLPLQPNKLQLARKLYREGVEKKDSMLIAEGYYEYGKLYTAASDYLTAKRWFIKALRILETRGDSYELTRLYVRLGDMAMMQAHYHESVRNAHHALAIAKRSHSNKALIRSFAILARIHERNWAGESPTNTGWPTSNSDSALYYFRKVEYLAYRLNDPMEVAHLKQDIGSQLLSRKDPRALAYLTTALSIANQQKQADQLPMTLSVASAYLTFDQPNQAWTYIMRAQRLYDEKYSNVYYWQVALEHSYIFFYQTIGNWKEAFKHNETVHKLEKNNYISDRDGAVSRLTVEYENEKKEALLKIQREELILRADNLLIHQRFTWAILALLLVTVGMSIVFFRLYRKNQRIGAKNAELVKEQNHRVKNNLQIVSSLLSLQANRLTDESAKNAVAEGQLRVEAMAILHRQLYDGDQLAMINPAEFIPELVDMVLQTFGYTHVRLVYDIDTFVLPADSALPVSLILNELTTNACKYAFPDHPDPVFHVSCRQKKNQIDLLVADNGPGMLPQFPTDARSTSSTSFGMRLIQMQVDQLRGMYTFTKQAGTVFTLTFTV